VAAKAEKAAEEAEAAAATAETPAADSVPTEKPAAANDKE